MYSNCIRQLWPPQKCTLTHICIYRNTHTHVQINQFLQREDHNGVPWSPTRYTYNTDKSAQTTVFTLILLQVYSWSQISQSYPNPRICFIRLLALGSFLYICMLLLNFPPSTLSSPVPEFTISSPMITCLDLKIVSFQIFFRRKTEVKERERFNNL